MTLLEESAAEALDGAELLKPRTYEVRTYGCQMNVHDSERLSGSLEAAGYVRAEGEQADIVVINTCAVRENADNKLYGNLGMLASIKREHEGMQIAVGGCLAQKDKSVILEKAPWVDVVFGTHNMGALPTLLERARHNGEAQLEILESLDVFPSTLPTRRESTFSGWVSVSVGCNNTCTFCIVPALRGKEKDRRPGDVLAEVQALVDDGAIEVTLLGQNVNSYGVEFGDRQAFGKLLRAAGRIDGLERIRFTSPHPAAFTDDVIDAMAETPAVMPQLHMPLQSGSDAILKAMKRSYRSEKFLGILDRVRAKIPNAAISTDIIVGFPGESEEDFQETLRVVRAARFASAFTFQYSIRPGTPAATMPNQVPKQIVQERYERLTALQDEISWDENKKLIGTEVRVLVGTEGSKDAATHRLSGRAEDSRLVHFEVPVIDSHNSVTGSANSVSVSVGSVTGAAYSVTEAAHSVTEPVEVRPGDIVTVTITDAKPFYLIADSLDGAPLKIRRTRAGDAWDRAEAASCEIPAHGSVTAGGSTAVSLGLPSLRVATMPIYDPADGQR